MKNISLNQELLKLLDTALKISRLDDLHELIKRALNAYIEQQNPTTQHRPVHECEGVDTPSQIEQRENAMAAEWDRLEKSQTLRGGRGY